MSRPTLTEEYWLLKGELASMTRQFEEARELVVRFTTIIQEQEKEITRLNESITRIRTEARSKHLSLESLSSGGLRDNEQGQGIST